MKVTQSVDDGFTENHRMPSEIVIKKIYIYIFCFYYFPRLATVCQGFLK